MGIRYLHSEPSHDLLEKQTANDKSEQFVFSEGLAFKVDLS